MIVLNFFVTWSLKIFPLNMGQYGGIFSKTQINSDFFQTIADFLAQQVVQSYFRVGKFAFFNFYEILKFYH